MTTIFLARHGETDWNRELRFQGHRDPPLNETGRRQARELAERLAGEELVWVYSSSLRRALETAELVARPLGLPLSSEDGLREVDTGSWSGLTRAEIEERYPEAFRRWLDYGPGWEDGESYEEMAGRVAATLDLLAARHPGERILVVTHGGPVRAAQAHALKIPFGEARRTGPPLHNCGLFVCDVQAGTFRRLD